MDQATQNGGGINLSHRAVAGCSFIQLMIGTVILVTGIILTVKDSPMAFIYTPIWSSLFILGTAVIGLFAAKYVINYLVVSTMVMCILTSSLIVPCIVGVMSTELILEEVDNCFYEYHPPYDYVCDPIVKTRRALEGVILVLAIAEFVMAIVTSAFCCGAVCCRSNNVQPVVHYVSYPQSVAFVTAQASQPVGVPGPYYQHPGGYQNQQFAPNTAYVQAPPMYSQQPPMEAKPSNSNI